MDMYNTVPVFGTGVKKRKKFLFWVFFGISELKRFYFHYACRILIVILFHIKVKQGNAKHLLFRLESA